MCWYCYWGLPKPVADIYLQALEKLDGYDAPLLYGPAHSVWEDYNLHDSAIKWSLAYSEEYKGDFTEGELLIVKQSLERLLEIPENERDIEPVDEEEYEDYDYESRPPPVGVVMVEIE